MNPLFTGKIKKAATTAPKFVPRLPLCLLKQLFFAYIAPVLYELRGLYVTIYLIFAVTYEPYALLSLCGNGQGVVSLILVAYGTADIDRRDTVFISCCIFHVDRPPICFAIVQPICGTFSIAHIDCNCNSFFRKRIIPMCILREYHRYGLSLSDESYREHSQGR